jgi:uridine kinase
VRLFDGVFVLRLESIDRWDLRIFVFAALEETLDRCPDPRPGVYGSTTEVERHYSSRCIPAQQLCFATARPTHHADIIVHNDELQQPAWEARTL